MTTRSAVPFGDNQAVEAPQPPAAPSAPAPATAAPAPTAAPRILSQEGMEALRDQRRELSNQLTSATGRREEIAEAIKNTPPGPARAGLEGRLAVLDERIMKLESDIAQTGQTLADAAGNLVGTTEPPQRFGPFTSGQATAVSIVSIVLVWAPLAFALGRTIMRRWAHPKPMPEVLASSARLERMEQAIDAMAIEIERISEGQRFVTQTLVKKEPVSALGAGQAPAQELRVGGAEQVSRG